MTEQQKERFGIFIIDFDSTVKDFQSYLETKETVKSIVLKTFIDTLKELVDEMEKDIEFSHFTMDTRKCRR